MVRAAMGAGWTCVLANDIDPMKCRVYQDNFGAHGLVRGDIATLDPAPLMRDVDLYWGSSPCQDFSLAGNGKGLAGQRSGVFRHWIDVIAQAVAADHAPRVIAFENVTGLLSRAGGADFMAVVTALSSLGYRVGGLEIDARHFVAQSRPRLFVICARDDIDVGGLTRATPDGPFHSAKLRRFAQAHRRQLSDRWVWWSLPAAPARAQRLEDVLDPRPDTPWFTQAEVRHLTAMMSPPSLSRLKTAQASGEMTIGTIYRRGRPDAQGTVRQRAELRLDGIAGCLRTPAGGSSRQTLVVIEGRRIRARLLSSREALRLMGLPDDYRVTGRYNEAYKVAGDGVVVPVVAHLDRHLFAPILAAARLRSAA